MPDADTVFRIASMTKSFTGAAVLLLRDEGALAPGRRGGAIPAVGLAGVRPSDGRLRASHLSGPLLTMAGGFPTDYPWGDRQQGLPDAVGFDGLARRRV